jgi:5-formyltetrahydrofolate cyclo-ligase
LTADAARVAAKRAARVAAAEVRATLHAADSGAAGQAATHALRAIAPMRHVGTVSGYLPVRSELDPRPAMLELVGIGVRICVPVIEARAKPLLFRAWTKGTALVQGPLGTSVPSSGDTLEPDVLLVPLLAFDLRCRRLGYGGGFFDRTIAALRDRREIRAYGFAYAGQRVEAVPHAVHDATLDAVITERGIVRAA